MKPCYVTTSWDDGSALDMRCLELHQRYGLRGTFYICSNLPNTASNLLTPAMTRTIADAQEIGAHTVTHARLTEIPEEAVRREVCDSKSDLEQLLGRPVDMFCYPFGAYNEAVRNVVQEAGFRGARTIKRYQFSLPDDPFQMNTGLRAFPHPYFPKQHLRQNWRFALRANGYDTAYLLRLGFPPAAHFSWVEMAKRMFDRVARDGGVWHLWGHSWEVEQQGMWDQLEEVFRYVAGREQVTYCTNGELIGGIRAT